MVRYWILLYHQSLYYRYILFILRALSILGLLFLLLDPWVSWTRNETNPQNISVILDLSESMFAHMDDYGIKFDKTSFEQSEQLYI